MKLITGSVYMYLLAFVAQACEDGIYPVAEDCAKFYQCVNGSQLPCQDCPPGLLFNPEILVCDWPQNVNCFTVAPTVAPTPSLRGSESESESDESSPSSDDASDGPGTETGKCGGCTRSSKMCDKWPTSSKCYDVCDCAGPGDGVNEEEQAGDR